MAPLRHVVESLLRYYSWCFASSSLVSSQPIPTRELCLAPRHHDVATTSRQEAQGGSGGVGPVHQPSMTIRPLIPPAGASHQSPSLRPWGVSLTSACSMRQGWPFLAATIMSMSLRSSAGRSLT